MADIRHLVRIEAEPRRVFELVSTQDGVARWWTPRVQGDDEPGGTLTFKFGDWDGQTDVRVREVVPEKRVAWDVVANNEGDEWPGTRIEFEIEPDEGGALLRFAHAGWREATDYFAGCNVFWGFFMRNVKSLAERGEPLPR